MSSWLPTVGATVFITDPGDRHLYVVLNNPIRIPERGGDICVLANITTCYGNRFDDLTCVFEPGCHSFITRRSYVFYRGTRVDRVSDLIARVNQRLYEPYQDPFTQEMVDKILAGFEPSPHSNADFREVAAKILGAK